MKPKFLFLFSSLCILCIPATGMFIQPEIKPIPLSRLLTNLTKQVEESPKDTNTLHQLARTHAMAYSSKLADADEVKAWKGWRGDQGEQPWFGHMHPHVPYNKIKPTEDEEAEAAAKAHLDMAIATYKKALEAKEAEGEPKPGEPRTDANTLKLGLAWCQLQAGQTEEAEAGLREVAEAAWEKESKSGGGLGNFLYVETIGYLIPLLDKEKNADEIAQMEERKKKLLSLPRAVTPLIVPVGENTDLNAMIDHEARVRFDLDGTGRQLEWPWITNNAAWLVYNPSGSGEITSSIQMFGSRTFLLFCTDGYQALALLDDNRDGTLRGKELEGLALWQDKDSDGISDRGEVRPLADHGITALSTRGQRHDSGMPFSPKGVTLKDGTTKPTYDLILESK